MATLTEVESHWAKVRTVVAMFDELKPWLAHGDVVTGLIRTHTTAALAAVRSGDRPLSLAYRESLRTDRITYDYIAWHSVLYANLLALRPSVTGLIAAFQKDKDRPFRNRQDAESITLFLAASIKDVNRSSSEALSLLATKPAEIVNKAGERVTITVTAAQLDPQIATNYQSVTAELKKTQITVQVSAEFLTQWTDEAFDQGLEQAAEALEEYYSVTRTLGLGKSKDKQPKRDKNKKREPATAPVPARSPGNEEDEEQAPAKMRFQVQWNSNAKKGKGQFSETAAAPWKTGVSTMGAIAALTVTHAKVVPERAKKASQPAVEDQIAWIKSRPPHGVGPGGYSWSKKFPYDYPDARVDVENLRGHNLRH